MPGKDRQRALARAKLERQMARRAAAARRRRQFQAGIGALVAVIVVIGGVIFLANTLSPKSTPSSAAASSAASTAPSAAPSTATSPGPSPRPGTCVYSKAGAASKDVGVPPSTNVVHKGSRAVTITTNVGTITASLDQAKAPCTTNSFEYLATKHYFNDSKCHRLTTSGIFVLQCGDPTGTGSGGPGYQFGEENLPKDGRYPAGTLAMANAGPGTNGSQFFIVYKDTQLPPSYTIFGSVTSGLDVVQKVANAGSDNASSAGDGHPKQEVKISAVAVS